MNTCEFVFTEELLSGGLDCWGVIIPPAILSRIELFQIYLHRLSLPSHFGRNFDALDECLRDLSWIDPAMQVVIEHTDIPLIENEEQASAYLKLLNDSIKVWQGREMNRLVVTFPAEVQELVKQLLEMESEDS